MNVEEGHVHDRQIVPGGVDGLQALSARLAARSVGTADGGLSSSTRRHLSLCAGEKAQHEMQRPALLRDEEYRKSPRDFSARQFIAALRDTPLEQNQTRKMKGQQQYVLLLDKQPL